MARYRKSFRRSGRKGGSFVKKAIYKAKRARFVRSVKKVIDRRAELKCQVLQDFTGFNVDNVLTNQILPLGSGIAQGTNEAERIGSKIRVKSAHIRWTIEPSTDAGTLSNAVLRMMVFRPKHRQSVSGDELPGAWPLGDITTALGTNQIRNMMADRDSFEVKYDKLIDHKMRVGEAGTGGDSAYQAEAFTGSIHVALNTAYEYNDAAINPGMAETVMMTWPWFFAIISDHGVTPYPVFSYQIRTYFTDI